METEKYEALQERIVKILERYTDDDLVELLLDAHTACTRIKRLEECIVQLEGMLAHAQCIIKGIL